ncbi:exodeoxyribonuclease III [Tumidithrix helvetica PCC 7403]|uniref:exodeoxyribonuclease III n=1 Tax=Tumidithrix helvetica TaxID=3457545 RepID=UPI003CB53432
MQIATWNVNSVRTRLAQVTNWLKTHPEVDLLCLQETKVIDADFPQAAFTELGYHTYIYGQKSYNGVAMISRQPISDVQMGFTAVLERDLGDLDEQRRLITGVIDQVRIVNMYVPNGSSLDSDKYDYKLRWLETLRQYLKILLDQDDEPSQILICGDFNVAVEDIDIHNPAKRETKVMATDAEREAMQAVLDLGFRDVFRKFTQSGGHYSWWDYRTGGFQRNQGWRIDYHFLTEALYDRAIACTIDLEPRKLPQPSDHTPVIVEIT